MAKYDIIGNIGIVKFSKDDSLVKKKKFAEKFLRERKSVRTVLEKSGKFSGRLRTQKTKFILGEKTKEALHRENNCEFRLNVDSCYFSPRLGSERMEIAKKVKRGERILVMFGGIGVYGIVIGKNSRVREVVSVELGRECNKYAHENVKRNKLANVQIIGGDVRKVVPKLKGKFDRIVMARPNLGDSFLDVAFKKIAKGGMIHYYGFYLGSEKEKLKELIIFEGKKAKKKIKIVKIKKAGEVGVKKYRFRVDMRVI